MSENRCAKTVLTKELVKELMKDVKELDSSGHRAYTTEEVAENYGISTEEVLNITNNYRKLINTLPHQSGIGRVYGTVSTEKSQEERGPNKIHAVSFGQADI